MLIALQIVVNIANVKKVFISICSIGVVWIYFTLPETTGMPLEEIATLFGDQDEVMVFSEDIQTGGGAGELVIREHQVKQGGDEENAEKREVPSHREIVELTI